MLFRSGYRLRLPTIASNDVELIPAYDLRDQTNVEPEKRLQFRLTITELELYKPASATQLYTKREICALLPSHGNDEVTLEIDVEESNDSAGHVHHRTNDRPMKLKQLSTFILGRMSGECAKQQGH